ncbi:MAG: MFS transporter [Thermaerobacter sp.]|jgi:MFS family permease|nr:MFS transporter [Thermaerobacter sp.]
MRSKTGILILMCLSMVLAYIPWYNYSAVAGLLSKQYHLNSFEVGLVISVFQLGYVIVVPFTGWLADRVGIRLILMVATILTAVFSTAFALFADSYVSILILRLLTGMAAGAIYAPGMALLSNWFEPRRRGMALGAYTGALVAAYAGSYFIAAPVAASFGWRAGVLWSSLPAFVGFVILFWVLESPPQAHLAFDGAGRPAAMLPQPCPAGGYAGPGLVTLSYMGHMWELYTFWGWIGPAMVAAAVMSGVAVTHAVAYGGVLAAVIILIGAPACYLWGLAADRFGRYFSIVFALVCSGAAEFLIGWTVHSVLLMTIVGLWIGFWVIADSAQYKAGLTEMSEKRVRTTLLGFQSALGFLMGVFGPAAFGALVMAFNHGIVNPVHATVWWPAFSILGLSPIIGIIAAMLLHHYTRQGQLMTGGRHSVSAG